MNLEESREGGPLKVRGDSGKLEKESPDVRSPEVGISVITQIRPRLGLYEMQYMYGIICGACDITMPRTVRMIGLKKAVILRHCIKPVF